MDCLKRYCTDIKDINGIKTYIVSPELLDEFFSGSDLLDLLSISYANNLIQYFVNEAKRRPSRIFFAITYHSNIKIKKLAWQPVNCYKDGDFYYHVSICDTWMCRECKHVNYGKFIRPIIEQDAIFYAGTDNKYPSIAPLFKRKNCTNCEKTLQNHFIYTNE